MKPKIVAIAIGVWVTAGCSGHQAREVGGAMVEEFVGETFELALDLALGNEIDSKEDAASDRRHAAAEARASRWRQAAYSASINAALSYVPPVPEEQQPRSIVMSPEPMPPPPSAVHMLDSLTGESSPD